MGVVRVGALARRTRLRARQVAAVVAVASLVSAGSKVAQAADSNAQAQANSGDAINQALLKKIEALEQRIKSLEARDKQQSTTADTTGSVKPQNKSGKHDELLRKDGRYAAFYRLQLKQQEARTPVAQAAVG